MRNLWWLLPCLLLLSCSGEKQGNNEITDYIPAGTSIAIQTNDPDLFFNNLRNNGFLKNNSSFPLIVDLRERFSAFDHFSQENPAIITFSGNQEAHGSITYISKGLPQPKKIDSTANKTAEANSSDSGKITSHNIDQKSIYTTQLGNIFIAAESKKILENLLAENGDSKMAFSADFRKALKAASHDHPTVFINHRNLTEDFLKILPEGSAAFLNNFSNWTAIDTEISQNAIQLDGITTASDSLPKFINLFKGVNPAVNEIAQVTPAASSAFLSYGFEDFRNLQRNLQKHKNTSEKDISQSKEQLLLENVTEAGIIYSEVANTFAVKVLREESIKSFSLGAEIAEDFRGTNIYNYEDKGAFRLLLQPLINPQRLQFFLKLENFILFSESAEQLKEIVSAFQNKNTFASSEAYIASSEDLSTEASILWVSKNGNFKRLFSETISEEHSSAVEDLEVKNFPFMALQLIYSSNFAHLHGILEKNEQKLSSAGVREIANISLDSEIAIPATFIRNHRSKGMDIAVQDENNQLYLISENGNVYWKKPLESRILGSVQQVDLLRNGRIQLIFATPGKLHVIDREGNAVAPFPLEFNDEITQPLAVFDYENNRKYRFVVVQGNEVFMYDNKGNRVRGFGFEKAKNRITQPPKHIRIGRKDYILITEASGKLNILDRRGNIRVSVKDELEPSGNPWFEYNEQFISTNADGELVKISQQGDISRENLNLTENHSIDATARSLVTLSDNVLNIKGRRIELDYGLYTKPKIFYLDNKLYFSVTDTQSNRIFLFDSNGELLPGFPVYGNSGIDLNDIDEDKSLEFVVGGGENNLLLYELKL